ncbi:lysoplasmalogenase family protein [Aurantiacibacter aquimixticola]|nr:lysoplasmalogenase family protein [Aurantiacibacter aquimixticola]
MPRRAPSKALVDKRPYLVLSVIAALAFYYMRVSALPELYLWPIKGSACAFLAIYAWLRHGSSDARLLAAAMAVASVADMAIEFDLRVGAGIFVIFHLMMIRLFMRHTRGPGKGVESVIFIALCVLPAVIAYTFAEGLFAIGAGVYGLALGIMAAAAWTSTFPRASVAAGAILFVLSDILIFAGLGPLSGSPLPEYLVWPIYYFGQFLITVGIVTTLRKRDPELSVIQGGAA